MGIEKENINGFTDNDLLFFYIDIILQYESEWKNGEFHSNSDYQEYCKKKSIIQIGRTKKLKQKVDEEYDREYKSSNGFLWLYYNDNNSKPIELLNRIRNCLAHGDYDYYEKNKIKYIRFEHVYRRDLKVIGFLSISELKHLIDIASRCMIN
ncbi:MAG: hypothetical protein RPU72_15260 [Candidatus Sedimenticola sp. (ex Thyasira tokunagai)]